MFIPEQYFLLINLLGSIFLGWAVTIWKIQKKTDVEKM